MSYIQYIEGWEPDISPILPNKNFTIVWSDFVYWFQLFIKQICSLMDDSTFTSRKSSLRALIWCIYLHFTKNVTYALLVLTPLWLLKIKLPTRQMHLYVSISVAVLKHNDVDSVMCLCVSLFRCVWWSVMVNFLQVTPGRCVAGPLWSKTQKPCYRLAIACWKEQKRKRTPLCLWTRLMTSILKPSRRSTT